MTMISHGAWDIVQAPIQLIQEAMGPLAISSVIMEGGAILHTLLRFSELLKGKRVLVFTDSLPFQQRFVKLSSPNEAVDGLIQAIAFAQLKHDFSLRLEYVASKDNLADSLSHHDIQRFRPEHSALGVSTNSYQGPHHSSTTQR